MKPLHTRILNRLLCFVAGHWWGHDFERGQVIAACRRCPKKVRGCPA